MNVQQAMALAGHRNPSTHMRYVRITEVLEIPAAAFPKLKAEGVPFALLPAPQPSVFPAHPVGFEPTTLGFEVSAHAAQGAKMRSISLVDSNDRHPFSSVIRPETIGHERVDANGRDQREGSAPSGHDGVAAALAIALERASGAGQWTVVGALAAELAARRQGQA